MLQKCGERSHREGPNVWQSLRASCRIGSGPGKGGGSRVWPLQQRCPGGAAHAVPGAGLGLAWDGLAQGQKRRLQVVKPKATSLHEKL